jgi:hypothetical protein
MFQGYYEGLFNLKILLIEKDASTFFFPFSLGKRIHTHTLPLDPSLISPPIFFYSIITSLSCSPPLQ